MQVIKLQDDAFMHGRLAAKGSFWNYLSYGSLNFPPHFAKLTQQIHLPSILHMSPPTSVSQDIF